MLPPRKVQFERRISIPPLQVRRALSGGYGGCLCQWELKAPTDRSQSDCVHEQVAKADCECPLYKGSKLKKKRTSDFMKVRSEVLFLGKHRSFKVFTLFR